MHTYWSERVTSLADVLESLQAEADKLVARWRPPASRNATVPESKQRETYVLKAWRLFRGLPEVTLQIG
jgi:hypothetical protein